MSIKSKPLHMIARKILMLVLILIAFRIDAYPQLNEAGKFELDTWRDRKVVIPFKLINNLIIIPLTINDSDTLNFILDTGVSATLITELREDEVIPINYVRTVKIGGLGEGDTIEAYYSPDNRIQIGKAKGLGQDVLIVKENIFHLSSFLGKKVNGLIGYSLFKDFIVEIDYQYKRVILHEHHKYEKKYREKKASNKWVTLPITLFRQKPYVDVDLVQKNGAALEVKLLLDSGASHGMALYHTANDQIQLHQNRIRSFLGSGISGEIHGYLGRIATLSIDKFDLNNVVASYPDEEGIRRALIYSERDGSIGAEVLKRFKVFLNYRDSTMILKPSKYFDDEFSYNISGIGISTPYPNVPVYSVTHVRDSSIAHKSDIRKGDILIEINRRGSQYYELTELNQLFQEAGKQVRLKILRGQEVLNKEFILEKEL